MENIKISITALSIPLNILGMECKGLGDKRITISNTLKPRVLW